MKLINPKPISEILREKELSKLPLSDIYQLIAQMNADLSAFLEHYFTQFPDQS